MATYKKRGNKIRKPKVTVEADAQNINYDGESTTEEVFDTLNQTANKSEQWLEKNQKLVVSVFGIALVIGLVFMLFNRFVQAPKEINAADDLAYAKQAFFNAEQATNAKDSLYQIALDGADGKYGLLDIVNKYGNTKAGNMATYMAGMAYSNLEDYKNAVDYLNKFSSDDIMLSTLAKGKIGDAFADINQPKDAYTYYKEVATSNKNDLTTPLYLFKAANVALELGNYNEALTFFTKIKNEYPKSDEAKEIDLYINRAKFASK